jgi:TolB-like protein
MPFINLSAKEKKHLFAEGITTLSRFKYVAAEQKRMRDIDKFKSEPCHECKSIARKLGLEV